jgi:hypothetical protein
MTAEFNAAVDLVSLPAPVSREETNKQLAAQRGEFVEGISDPADPKWVKDELQPQVENLGGGMFSIDGLMNEKQPENDDRSPVKRRPPAMCRWKRLSQRKSKLLMRYQQAKALMQLSANSYRSAGRYSGRSGAKPRQPGTGGC